MDAKNKEQAMELFALMNEACDRLREMNFVILEGKARELALRLDRHVDAAWEASADLVQELEQSKRPSDVGASGGLGKGKK